MMSVGGRTHDRCQAFCLQTLAEQAHQPFTLRKDLTRAEASKLINEMERSRSAKKAAQTRKRRAA
jgi:hypothetical protein